MGVGAGDTPRQRWGDLRGAASGGCAGLWEGVLWAWLVAGAAPSRAGGLVGHQELVPTVDDRQSWFGRGWHGTAPGSPSSEEVLGPGAHGGLAAPGPALRDPHLFIEGHVFHPSRFPKRV